MALSNKIISPTEYAFLSANTGTGVLKTEPGFLHAIVINDVGIAGDLGIYDDTWEGTLTGCIATISLTTRAAGSQIPFGLILDVNFGTGLAYAREGSISVTFSYN